jgi:chorismate mutase/prephenate dehydrogenase
MHGGAVAPTGEQRASATPAGRARIGVVGGAGQMGLWLRRFWERLGHEVRYSDRDTALSNEDLVSWAQITFVAVPLDVTPRVLRELAPCATDDRALVSIASLMGPSAEALTAAPADALCAHPVFGPTVISTAGLPVIVAPVRGTRWADWLVSTLRAAGLAVHVTTPETHDARMAMVQALLHSLYVALCQAFAAADVPAADAISWASPTLRLQLGMAARILGQDPALYADLVVGNPAAPAALDLLVHTLQSLADLARAGDREGFMASFVAARQTFGPSQERLAAEAEDALARLQ